MGILNYTTKVPVGRTVAEVSDALAKHGATSVMIDYDGGEPDGLSFQVAVPVPEGRPVLVAFRLPTRWRGVLAAMQHDKSVPQHFANERQAQRVAWRIVKDWTEAQLAMIDAGLATLTQVMLPYAVTNSGETVYDRLERHGPGTLQLEAPA